MANDSRGVVTNVERRYIDGCTVYRKSIEALKAWFIQGISDRFFLAVVETIFGEIEGKRTGIGQEWFWVLA